MRSASPPPPARKYTAKETKEQIWEAALPRLLQLLRAALPDGSRLAALFGGSGRDLDGWDQLPATGPAGAQVALDVEALSALWRQLADDDADLDAWLIWVMDVASRTVIGLASLVSSSVGMTREHPVRSWREPNSGCEKEVSRQR